MSGLAFEIQWETSLSGNISREMQATWAHLEILVEDAPVTNCVVGNVSKRRILIPLSSLAEWLAFNWWRLLYEPFCRGREVSECDYLDRHSLLSARDGFALPDLRFYPEGDLIRLSWLPHKMTYQPLEFFSCGEVLLPRSQVVEAISSLIEQVLERLASQQIKFEPLVSEWTAIHGIDSDEARFCQSAARLAVDPFDLSDERSELIEVGLMGFTSPVRDELASAATIENLPAASRWIQSGMQRTDLPRSGSLDWQAAKQQLSSSDPHQPPWKTGYELATQFRRLLSLGHDVPTRLPDFENLTINAPPPIPTIDGLVVSQGGVAPVCLTGKKRVDSRRFQFARSICEYFSTPDGSPSLMTTGPTDAQKKSRAFAAELLAPENALRARLKSTIISDEELEDFAAEFQVSSKTIEYQLQNHQLATVY